VAVPTISAFWGDRQAESTEIAVQLASFLEQLADEDPRLSRWRPKGGSRKAATLAVEVPLDAVGLLRHLKVQRRDSGHEPMAELGYSFDAWNGGHGGADAAVSCTAGLHAHNANLRNSVVVTAPEPWLGAPSKTERLVIILRATWDPDEIVLFDHPHRQTLWAKPEIE
jgi:hypothetical protein